jgi:streptomycin 6-kinase
MVAALFPASLPVYATAGDTAAGRAWLDRLPALAAAVSEDWSLRLLPPYPGGMCSWVAPVIRADGRAAVLKLSWPHREASGEAAGLRAWAGRGAVRLLAHDAGRHALLLECCEPGTSLAAAHDMPASRRLRIATELLAGLWPAKLPTAPHGIEPLSAVMNWWADLLDERRRRVVTGYDPGLLAHGSGLLRELPPSATREVLLHGDFHPGNILAAGRAPWLCIDPKPMIGDPAFDPVPLIEQVDDPYQQRDPARELGRRAASAGGQLGVPADRILAWALARNVEYAMSCADGGDIELAGEAIANARTVAGVLGV